MKRVLTGLADIIFPPRCSSCDTILHHQTNLPLCHSCFSKISFIQSPLCTLCGIPFAGAGETDHPCGDCLTSSAAFSIARAVGRYENTLLEIIHRFKYKGKTALGKVMGGLMADFTYSGFAIEDYSVIMPVPLHGIRLRERGFNQAVILAGEIAGRFSIKLDFMTLKRHIHTEPQVNLAGKERESNVYGAFHVTNAYKVKGQKIILVDDVYTTGSTAKECARVLMDCDASDVAVLTLARAM